MLTGSQLEQSLCSCPMCPSPHTAGSVPGVEEVLLVNACREKFLNMGMKEKLQLHMESVSDTCSPGQVHRAAWSSTLGEVPVAELIGAGEVSSMEPEGEDRLGPGEPEVLLPASKWGRRVLGWKQGHADKVRRQVGNRPGCVGDTAWFADLMA